MGRIAITGALGHIGSSFIHDLRPGDYDEVVLVDNLSAERYCSLFNLPDGVPYRVVQDDICTANLDEIFAGVEHVIHLAAITNAAGSFGREEEVEQVNYLGTCRVAEACAKTGSRLLFLSSTSVYGTQAETVDEDCSIEDLQPQSPYAGSKLRAEAFLETLSTSAGLRYFIGRFGTICGVSPGMRFHTAINKFCWQATIGEPLTVWRTALDQVRPYLDVSDAVRALRFVLRSDLFDNRVYNVLTENVTVRQILDVIRAEIPDTQMQFVDTRIMNQLSYRVLAERFARAGFQSTGTIRGAILDTLHLFRGVSSTRLGTDRVNVL
jgi:UDP-glucose 4-epimerase